MAKQIKNNNKFLQTDAGNILKTQIESVGHHTKDGDGHSAVFIKTKSGSLHIIHFKEVDTEKEEVEQIEDSQKEADAYILQIINDIDSLENT
jgi:hypothetical protein